MAFVGNMSRYSLGLPVVRDARPDDGLLDLLILPCRNHLQLLGHSLRTVLARHVERGGARYLRFRRIRIESPERVPFELDGDCGGRLPLDVEVRPKALYVRLPPG
jgi:diacylglycerol kinase family enzyme